MYGRRLTREQAHKDVELYAASVARLKDQIDELYNQMAEDAQKLHEASYYLGN